MKLRFLALSIAVASAFSFNAFGTLGGTDAADIKDSVRPGIYRVQQANDLQPESWIVNGQTLPNNDGLVMSIDAGEAVHATEISPNEILITLKRSDEEVANGDIPEQVIVTREEFNNSGLAFYAAASVDQLSQYETGLAYQSASRGGVHVSSRQHRIGSPGRGSRHYAMPISSDGRFVGVSGNCVQVVQNIIHEYSVLGNGGVLAANLLATERWVRTSEGTPGSVCSWRQIGGGAGHVAYWDGACYQPKYPSSGRCGNPGSRFQAHPYLCVRRTMTQSASL